MYSLNAPVPASVARLASGLAADLLDAGVRERHTLVVKRLGDDPGTMAPDVRAVVEGTDPFEARVTGVEAFRDPPRGTAPVAYLRVESPGLRRLHGRLCDRFAPVDGLEGDDYTPHVTLGRGGDVPPAAVDRLREHATPVEWTVDRLYVYDATYDQVATELSLPP